MRGSSSLLLALIVGVALVAAPSASASYAWHSGGIQETWINNCINGTPENGAGTWMSAYLDLDALPHVGDTWYGASDAAGIGNPCAGTYVHFEVIPPAGTAPAVTSGTPIFCYLGALGGALQRDTVDCPTQFGTVGPKGGYQLNPTTRNDGVWPLPQGYMVELQYPLQSSSPLSAATATLTGASFFIDGQSSPTLYPTVPIAVLAGPGTGGGGAPTGGAPGALSSQTQTQSQTQAQTQQGSNVALAPSGPTVTAAHVPAAIGSAAATRKGVPVSVTNAFDGSTDEITIQAATGPVRSLREAKTKTVRLGHLVRTGAKQGSVAYRVKLSKRALKKALGKRRTVKAQVLVTVSAPGHSASTLARSLKLKR